MIGWFILITIIVTVLMLSAIPLSLFLVKKTIDIIESWE